MGANDTAVVRLVPPSRQRTTAEIVAERLRVLEDFVARYGLDYWDTHTEPPTADTVVQLTLEQAA